MRTAQVSWISRTAAILASVTSAVTLAQEPRVSTEGRENLGEVVVTGTRVLNPNATAASPIATVTAGDILAQGETNVAETLRELPSLIDSNPISDSFERLGFANFGTATLNLRGLGPSRTLVLVNGRRHVAGLPGTQAVDVATIPSTLIERVDVLTGGASSIYGADAVTGVVNFVMKDQYEGFDVRSQFGVSAEGDARTTVVEAVWGSNFSDERGNIVFAASFEDNDELVIEDREFSLARNRHWGLPNAARVLQPGEITSATPNFAAFYNINRGSYPYGSTIPSAAQFTADYTAAFGTAPALTTHELALIERGAGAPPQAITDGIGVVITSSAGLISRADGLAFTTDVDGNGVPDCQQSVVGATTGACYVTVPEGGVRPFRDGANILSEFFHSDGSDGSGLDVDTRSIMPGLQRYNANLLGSFEFSAALEAFGELKFVHTDVEAHDDYPAFLPSLQIQPDNPFIPQLVLADAQAAGGLRMSRDGNSDLGTGLLEAKRDTSRAVAGLRGELLQNLRYEVSAVYGRTESDTTSENNIYADRLFSGLDVVSGPNGQPICRSDVDGTTPPLGTPAFVTFTPGDGSCRPYSLFNGANSINAEAVAWILAPTTTSARLEQTVVTGHLTGDSQRLFSLPGGPVRFAVGAEYREEESRTLFDPLSRGILPVDSPAGQAGQNVGEATGGLVNTLFLAPISRDLTGKYDVTEVYGEIDVPLFRERPFVDELRIGGSARASDYSTVGSTFAWSANAVYAPIRDVKLRGTYSEAVRAPNITELYTAEAPATFFGVTDPCDEALLDAFIASGDPRAQNRLNNCRADQIPEGFSNALVGNLPGVRSGNPNLEEETAETYTVGVVLQPRFAPQLTLSVDYYDIKITGAIANVAAQDTVNNCYDASSLDNQYCPLFTRDRNSDPNDGFTFLDLNFLRSTGVNFGRLETAGIDFALDYRFDFGRHQFGVRGVASHVKKLVDYFSADDPNLANPRLKELGSPEWSGVGALSYAVGPFSLQYRAQYIGEQALWQIQIETIETFYGEDGAGMAPEKVIQDVSASFDLTESVNLYGGVNNFTDSKPFVTNVTYPVSGVGRFFYLGGRVRF